ncbi:MAG: methylenetetrahydrofolate reductase C-terminal domain-containing protein [Candidatus Margulisiibacteriota bacterium]
MIITEPKPFEKILESLQNAEKVIVLGCSRCATGCGTGGEKEVAAMAEKLKKAGKEVLAQKVLESPCDDRLNKRDFKEVGAGVFKVADAVLVMSCGAGVQTIADLCDLPVFPALDSLFLGRTKRVGRFYEMCVMCGDCVLDQTGGICPVSRCSKRLLNGPCGGSHDGKCEVNPNLDCAWYLIYEKLKAHNKLDKMESVKPPKDYSKVIRPRKVELR